MPIFMPTLSLRFENFKGFGIRWLLRIFRGVRWMDQANIEKWELYHICLKNA